MGGDLQGKVAVVTGAGRGIGKSIARRLAAQGARVALAARTESQLSAVASSIEEVVPDSTTNAPRTLTVPTDVREEPSVRHLMGEVRQTYGRLDILVNSAGVLTKKPLEQTSSEEWDQIMEVNARGPFLVCREAIPLLRETDDGLRYVVNIASVVGIKGYVGQGAYTASKHALMGLSKVLSKELEDDGIRVHAICPGGVATEMVKESRPDLDESVLMEPDDIADIVEFLVTRQGNAVVDQVKVRRQASDPWF